MMDKKKEIIIDLDRSKYPNISHELDELIQQEAIDKLKEHMNNVIKEYNDTSKQYMPEFNDCPMSSDKSSFIAFGHFRRRHDVIALLGERGTGKSNFLVNLKTILGEENFAFLKIIDPTLFDDRQNILVAIIFMIQDIVEKYRKPEESSLYKDWISILSDLAEGLNLVDDGIGNNPMQKDLWDDARLVMDRGLNVSRHGYTFERNFHKLLSYSLQLIGKKAIILRFDDIDTNPEKGWHVLEVIRKYLTTPHLQVIISGDLKLYSKIVRLEQWKRLHKLQEYGDDENIKRTIDNLEEQYLSKILQPTNRIFLRTLRHSEYSNEDSYRVLLKKKNKIEKGKIEKYLLPQEPTIKNVYTKIFSEIFNLSHNLLDGANSLMMTLPIRTNLQVLRAYNESLSNDDDPILNKKIFMSKFTNVFLTLIDRFDFSYRDFNKLFEPAGYSFLANKMYHLSEKYLEVNFRNLMTPQVVFEDEDINLFLLFIYGFVGQSMNKSPNLIFDWYYRIHILSVLITKMDSSEKLLKARMYLDYRNRISTYKVAIKFSGLLLKNENGKNQYLGLASIYRDQKEAKIHYALNSLEKNIEQKVYTDKEEVNKFILLLFSIAAKEILVRKDKQTLSLIGIHYIFGFLANTIENDDSAALLKKMSYPNKIREFKDGENTDSRISYGERIYNSQIIGNCNSENSCEIVKFSKELNDWKQKIKDEKIDNFSIQQINYLWNEFDLRESEIDYTDSAGEYLEIQIFLFLDVLMRAQLNYEQLISYKVIKKPKKARTMFLENVKKYYKVVDSESFHSDTNDLNAVIDYVKNKKILTLFDFFIICPLWNYYIHYSELKSIPKAQGELPMDNDKDNATPLDLAKETGYYSGIFKDLEIVVSEKAREESSLRQRSIGKTDEQIIRDEIELIDENNLARTIKSLMQKAKDPETIKRITKKRIDGWIKIYNDIISEEK